MSYISDSDLSYLNFRFSECPVQDLTTGFHTPPLTRIFGKLPPPIPATGHRCRHNTSTLLKTQQELDKNNASPLRPLLPSPYVPSLGIGDLHPHRQTPASASFNTLGPHPPPLPTRSSRLQRLRPAPYALRLSSRNQPSNSPSVASPS